MNKEKANNFWKEEGLNKSNNIDHLFYTNNKNLIFKSKQIGKTKYLPSEILNEPLFFDNYLYFNDLAGNIYKYSISQKKIIWKYNFYKKKFKKIPIRINIKLISNSLVVSDNLGYFYNLSSDNGKLIWAKNQSTTYIRN